MEGSSINRIQDNIRLLISRYEEEKLSNQKLRTELSDLSDKLNFSNKRITELEQQLDNLQLKEAFKSSSKDVTQAKKKITFLIKEIDNCIELIDKGQ